MRVYVAAKWEDRERAREVMWRLERSGHTVTYDWTRGPEDLSAAQALIDIDGVRRAEALVFLADRKYAFMGALVEFGVAVERGIPIYLVGGHIDACIFTYLPQVERMLHVSDLPLLAEEDL